MGSQCSLCVKKPTNTSKGLESPLPNQKSVLFKISGTKKKGSSKSKSKSSRSSGYDMPIQLTQCEMLPNDDISNIDLALFSIREEQPTNREIREHKDRLRAIQSHLHLSIQMLNERLQKVRSNLYYGVSSQKFHTVVSQHRKSSQSQKKDSLKWNKVVIEIENFEFVSSRHKQLAIKIEIPKEASPDPDNSQYYSQIFKIQESINNNNSLPTFILLFQDGIASKKKKFTVSIVEPQKYKKPMKEVGTKYTFMIDQLNDGKVGNKDLYIFPQEYQNEKPEIMLYKSGVMLFSDGDEILDSSGTLRKQMMLCKVQLKLQLIKDEESKLLEYLANAHVKLYEVQSALDSIRQYNQQSLETSLEFYSQGFLNISVETRVVSHSHQVKKRTKDHQPVSGMAETVGMTTEPNTNEKSAGGSKKDKDEDIEISQFTLVKDSQSRVFHTDRKIIQQFQNPSSQKKAFNEIFFNSNRDHSESQEGGFYITQHDLSSIRKFNLE